jgi:colicin import membrane protein
MRLAGVLAIAVHAIALVALTWGFHIQREQKAPVMAELWSALPPTGADPEKAAAPRLAPVVPPPEPAPRPVPRPEPVEPKDTPAKTQTKSDIEIKAKEAKARQADEERRKLDEARKREKDALAEKARIQAQTQAQAQEQAKAQKAEQAKLAEADRARREQDDLARKAAEAAASAQAKLLASAVDRIRAKVRSLIVEPPGVAPNATAEFDVVLIPGGDVLSVKLRRSSGNALYDEAVERAIHRAEPLPIPPDPKLFPQFRELRLQIRPQE